MRALIPDVSRSPFLDAVGERDRTIWRVAAFVPLAIVVALVTAVVGSVLVSAVWAGVAQESLQQALDELTHGDRPGRGLLSYVYELAVAGPSSFVAAAAVLALAAWLFRRPIRSFLTAAARYRWGLVGWGLAAGAAVTGVAFLAERMADPEALAAPILSPATLAERLGYAAAAAACLYLAAFAEEAIFRGWLLQQTAAWTRRLWVILAINGVFFSLAHLDPSAPRFALRMVMGAGWAWIALRTAGVEFTTGAHLANNLFVALFVSPVTFTQPKATTGGLAPALIELATVLVTAAAAEALMRRNRGEFAREAHNET